jgi:hypothetical protein
LSSLSLSESFTIAVSAENVEFEYVDQENQSERELESEFADPLLEDVIARMVDNIKLRDSWVLPIEQENITKTYEALGRLCTMDAEDELQGEVEGCWDSSTEDMICKYNVGRSWKCWSNH